MTLPVINTPEYKLKVPSTDEEIRYRPFLVKEEKLLMVASETGDDEASYNAIRKIIEACVLDPITIDRMPLFDMEYIFLNIRAKSVGEIADIEITCPDDEKTKVKVQIKLDEIMVHMEEDHDPRIELTEDIGLLMSYPSLGTIGLIQDTASDGQKTGDLFELICNCMHTIWQGEETWDAFDYTLKDKMSFLESLNHKQFEKIQYFFDHMPTLKHEIKVTNPKTKKKSTVTLEGMNAFF